MQVCPMSAVIFMLQDIRMRKVQRMARLPLYHNISQTVTKTQELQ